MNILSTPFTSIKKSYLQLSAQKVLLVWVTLFLSALFLLISLIILNDKFVITIPKRGGELREGILGTPRFINPVLATNSQDETLTGLIFSGLTKIDKNNEVILDTALSIEKSEDELTYTVTLKDGLAFHDGEKLTTDDILFTLSLIQNPVVKSPLKIKWEGVKAEKISDTKILFTLRQPYPLFERSLSVGILPKHVWKNLSIEEFALSDLNVNAVGSGPYKIENIESVSGIPRIFTLAENKYYALGRPYISTLVIHSYQTEKLLEQAFVSKEIDTLASTAKLTSPLLAKYTEKEDSMTLPQTISIFFNPNKQAFLADKDIREALLLSLHKKDLLFSLYGDSVSAATTHFPFMSREEESSQKTPAELISKSAFKKKNASSSLAITLTIGDSEENRKLAEVIKEKWDAVGVTTTVEIFEFSDLSQKVIKPRDFQAVLSGTLIEDVSDLYAFWHSSQRSYPGLNISSYVSAKMDKNLEDLRSESDTEKRLALGNAVEEELALENPAIFLYHPKLLYIKNNKVRTSFPHHGMSESARFSDITSWYLETEKVWKFSYQQKVITWIEALLH